MIYLIGSHAAMVYGNITTLKLKVIISRRPIDKHSVQYVTQILMLCKLVRCTRSVNNVCIQYSLRIRV